MGWIINSYLEFLKWIVLGAMELATVVLIYWVFASIITFAACKYDDWFDRLVKEEVDDKTSV